MPWIRRVLRGQTVFARADADGQLATGSDGRVDIAYKAQPGAKLYRAAARNLTATGDPDDEQPLELDIASSAASSDGAAIKTAAKPHTMPKDAIIIYTDGACSGNPGPAGIGVVLVDGKQRKELSEYLGQGTNNIAELTAIKRALELVDPDERGRPVYVHSDSSYSLGLLGKGWKAKKNVELVAELRELAAQFPRLELVKVKGHAGVPENERCDQLAVEAVARRR